MRASLSATSAALVLAAACSPPRAPASPERPVRIVVPAPGETISESYPPPSLPTEPVRRAVFEQINRDRAESGIAPVAWDEAASRVAEAFCAAQVAEKTRGHFLRDGVPPYARTGLAGVFGYQSENSASWSTTASTFEATPPALALSAEQTMLSEKPPADGHRRALLDPEATHVGVGWAMRGGRFQLAEEFLSRGLDRLSVRSEGAATILRVEGAARPAFRLAFVTVAREPLPAALTQAEANARTSYKYPSPTVGLVAEGRADLTVVGTATRDRIRLGRDSNFSFAFAPDAPGLWTFVFWLVETGEDRPRPSGSAVVRVEG